MKELNKIWEDQKNFNLNFFPSPENFTEQSSQTKEYLIHLMSEMDELLRCTEWKHHRKNNPLPNISQVKNELTDIFKYYISLCLIWNVNPTEVIQDYWRKSMVCRQRYSEEFCNDLDGDIALIDIDGVLADYKNGLAYWIILKYPHLTCNVNKCLNESLWINSTNMNVSDVQWQNIKHHFRVSGGKLGLPICKDAKQFLEKCKSLNLKIILLTSRPIDLYPNIYTDTLEWLHMYKLPFDYLWWSENKKEKIISKNLRSKIRFAVDDELDYANTYSRLDIPCFWIDHGKKEEIKASLVFSHITRVKSLSKIMEVI